MKKTLLSIITLSLLLASVTAFMPARASAATAKGCNERTFSTRINRRDPCVAHIQSMLNTMDNAGLVTDHIFGPKTKAAVKARQQVFKSADANVKVDGVVGQQTWSMLCALRANYPAVADQAGCNGAPKTPCKSQVFSTRTNAYNQYCVTVIRNMLNLLHDPVSLSAGDPYNTNVRTAVKAWQQHVRNTSNPKMKVDGIVGRQTWQSFCNAQLTDSTDKMALMALKLQAGC